MKTVVRSVGATARKLTLLPTPATSFAAPASPGPIVSVIPELRLGLCCLFAAAPIKFRTTTATAMLRLPARQRRARLAELCAANAEALLAAIEFCAAHGIRSFRINSQILPLRTHPKAGYNLGDLPGGGAIVARFRACGAVARERHVRLSFHPDQFVVLNSPNPLTLASSLAELTHQTEVAEWVGADTVNLHGGGAYGNKPVALADLRRNIEQLPANVRTRLTLENDDKIYTPSDLLPVCEATGVPFVYDVHHHRCNPDGLSVAEATARARGTWRAEPLFHISSPREGWKSTKPHPHHDYIDAADFPDEWFGWPLTVEVEAKAKELAVTRLQFDLEQRALNLNSRIHGKPPNKRSRGAFVSFTPSFGDRGLRVTKGERPFVDAVVT